METVTSIRRLQAFRTILERDGIHEGGQHIDVGTELDPLLYVRGVKIMEGSWVLVLSQDHAHRYRVFDDMLDAMNAAKSRSRQGSMPVEIHDLDNNRVLVPDWDSLLWREA